MSRKFLFVLEQNTIARENAYTLVEYTTAYPFRLPDCALMCVFCCESFREPEVFRQHMQDEHQDYKAKHAFHHIHEGYLKVDITDLRCRVCNEAFKKLEDIARHLRDSHKLSIDLDNEIGLFPFRMEKGGLSCPICDSRSANIRALSRHVQSHFLQCICEHCGKAYPTNTSLRYHVKNSCLKSGDRKLRCKKCRKVITSTEEHLKNSVSCWQHTCSLCGERFAYWKMKLEHMEIAHGVPKPTYKCPDCDEVFNTASKLKTHFKIMHTDDHLTCAHCGLKFDSRYRLDRHMLIHTGEKEYICSVCSKQFSRKSTLTQHMWIHSDTKKYVCELCHKPFNQKVCWKTHMKTRHPEHYDPKS